MLTHPCPCRFRNGSWFKKREGTIIQVNQCSFQLTKVFYEKYKRDWEQWKVLFEGFDIHSSSREIVILKFRYALVLFPFFPFFFLLPLYWFLYFYKHRH
jgi:hypothetical protein